MKNNNPKISIIIPVYNVEKYFQANIESILSQTFSDFEAIFIIDGSPDNCESIIKEYAKKDSRIKVLSQENKGVSIARNAGLEVAKGDYIAFSDPDDIMHPKFLEVMHSGLDNSDLDFVFCEHSRFNSDEEINIKPVNSPKTTVIDNIWRHFVLGKKPKLYILLWDKLIKKEILHDVWFNPNIRYSEDSLYSYNYFCNVKKIMHIDASLICYRQTGTGLSSEKNYTRKIEDVFRYVNDITNTLSNAQIDKDIRNILNKNLNKRVFYTILKYINSESIDKDYLNTVRIRFKKLFKDGKLKLKFFSTKNKLLYLLFCLKQYKLVKSLSNVK